MGDLISPNLRQSKTIAWWVFNGDFLEAFLERIRSYTEGKKRVILKRKGGTKMEFHRELSYDQPNGSSRRAVLALFFQCRVSRAHTPLGLPIPHWILRLWISIRHEVSRHENFEPPKSSSIWLHLPNLPLTSVINLFFPFTFYISGSAHVGEFLFMFPVLTYLFILKTEGPQLNVWWHARARAPELSWVAQKQKQICTSARMWKESSKTPENGL